MATTFSQDLLQSYSRTTRDGRKLTYEMTVLQQPQRARACGSGAKSSADRRPVDPPPVVELKVLEGDSRKDITFQHSANFFLFTTLEPARNIAPVRGSSNSTSNAMTAPHPVLTGMPVAGMAYLDRPTQAGYFIFPDLSVRHEGKFKLSFNLYEQLKDPKDMDPAGVVPPTPTHEAEFGGNFPTTAPGMEFVHFRMEIASHPFTVYSAKKFPGLSESTTLSRLVAEQGCRVRIRRDVRMRRSKPKSSKDYDNYSEDEQTPYSRDRFSTPDSYSQHNPAERGQSSTAVSVVDPRSYSLERRSSGADLASYYQNPAQYPQPVRAQSEYGGHLQYVETPTQHHSLPNYASQNPYPQANGSHVRQSSSNSSLYAAAQPTYQQPQQQQQQQQPTSSRPQTQAGPANSHYDFPAVDTRFANLPSTSNYANPDGRSNTSATHPQLPPLKDITDHKYTQSTNTPISASSPATYDTYSTQPTPTSIPVAQVGKRAFGRTFDEGHMGGPMVHGSRPMAVGQDTIQIECEDGTLIDQDELPSLKMLSYRRADGSRQHKKIPAAF